MPLEGNNIQKLDKFLGKAIGEWMVKQLNLIGKWRGREADGKK
jgi:hypothetical protein